MLVLFCFFFSSFIPQDAGWYEKKKRIPTAYLIHRGRVRETNKDKKKEPHLFVYLT